MRPRASLVRISYTRYEQACFVLAAIHLSFDDFTLMVRDYNAAGKGTVSVCRRMCHSTMPCLHVHFWLSCLRRRICDACLALPYVGRHLDRSGSSQQPRSNGGEYACISCEWSNGLHGHHAASACANPFKRVRRHESRQLLQVAHMCVQNVYFVTW